AVVAAAVAAAVVVAAAAAAAAAAIVATVGELTHRLRDAHSRASRLAPSSWLTGVQTFPTSH
ncbi:MAG TPA: hypothetical protein VER04_28610, partial [Polyangiaceae bacterium]|nr:hypothetical protein [Polyangiaceae bacterium]